MQHIIPDNIFRNITAERYLWICNYARKLYKAAIDSIKQDNLNREQTEMIIKDIYSKNEMLFGANIDEKQVFYLNLLVDSEELLKELKFLYGTYLEEDKMEEFEMLEYYERNGYKEKVNIIIEIVMNFYGLTYSDARDKINDAIHYSKIKELRKYDKPISDKPKVEDKKHNEKDDTIDLLAVMQSHNYSFDHFTLPDDIAAFEEDRPSKSK